MDIVPFDFKLLDPETRIVVYQENKEFDQNMDEANWSFVRACKNLQRIHEALRYKRPGFDEYCNSKPGLSRRTAYKMLNVAQMCAQSAQIQSKAALYLLAAPSTPEEARQEAFERAANGEAVTHTLARDIVLRYKEQPADDDEVIEVDFEHERVTGDEGLAMSRHAYGVDEPASNNGMSQELRVLLSHESTEWYTPEPYIVLAREVMGDIDLDPATSIIAQKWIKAKRIYTYETNGLAHAWLGRTWLNPPYSKTGNTSNQEIWSEKLIVEYHAGRVSEAILLCKSALGYQWFENLWDQFPVCFARERIPFVKPDGSIPGEAKLGSAFFYLGNQVDRFREVFGPIGRIWP